MGDRPARHRRLRWVVPAVLGLALAACGVGPGPAARVPASGTSGTPATGAAGTPSGSGAAAGPPASTGAPGAALPEGEPTAGGPGDPDLRAAREAVAAMSVEEAAGQVLVVRTAGTDLADAADLVADLHLAGVIVFELDGADPASLRAATTRVQDAVAAGGRDWPAVVSVDQEGGRVARIGPPATAFPAFLTHGAAEDADLTAAATRASGRELRALGLTTVFAPVADVTSGPEDPTIGDRSASDDPERVAAAVRAAVAGYRRAGVVAVAKHYPGHGSVPVDSHRALPVQDASAAELAARDLVPFEAAVTADVPAVMMSHIAVTAWEPGVPASLSAEAYRHLREGTGFDGVAVTDALDMAAVTGGGGEPAVRALAAGADLLLMPADVRAAHAAVVAAVASGEVPRERLDEAATRVVAMMRRQQRRADRTPVADSEVGAYGHLSYETSLAGTVLLDARCGDRLVGDAVRVAGGTERDRALLTEAARAVGLQVGSGDVVRLLGGPTSSGAGDVVVALGAPYGLGASSATSARVALNGRTPEAFRVLVDVLTGRAWAGGTMPVDVPGVGRGAGCG